MLPPTPLEKLAQRWGGLTGKDAEAHGPFPADREPRRLAPNYDARCVDLGAAKSLTSQSSANFCGASPSTAGMTSSLIERLLA
jgi:hypothetical protein